MKKYLLAVAIVALACANISFSSKAKPVRNFQFDGPHDSFLADPLLWSDGIPSENCVGTGTVCYVTSTALNLEEFRELIETYQPASVNDVENIPYVSVEQERSPW